MAECGLIPSCKTHQHLALQTTAHISKYPGCANVRTVLSDLTINHEKKNGYPLNEAKKAELQLRAKVIRVIKVSLQLEMHFEELLEDRQNPFSSSGPLLFTTLRAFQRPENKRKTPQAQLRFTFRVACGHKTEPEFPGPPRHSPAGLSAWDPLPRPVTPDLRNRPHERLPVPDTGAWAAGR
ncbi:hypothetical protein HPG69_008327 [Diceros bicornis minor]|uniref:Uncharacterized protein n=1 Tax=Diceros bicornis minor TaxID=77932 RepID=A0A7J7F0H9_DICBM|nr:hypothetical protein HPG69_008327 [Diceros bicornis minor]